MFVFCAFSGKQPGGVLGSSDYILAQSIRRELLYYLTLSISWLLYSWVFFMCCVHICVVWSTFQKRLTVLLAGHEFDQLGPCLTLCNWSVILLLNMPDWFSSSWQERKMSAVIKFIFLSAYQCCFEPWLWELLSVLGMWECRLNLSQCLGILLGFISVKLCLWAETSFFLILSQKEACFPDLWTKPAADCILVDSTYSVKGFTLHCLVPAEVRSYNFCPYLGVIFVWFHCS